MILVPDGGQNRPTDPVRQIMFNIQLIDKSVSDVFSAGGEQFADIGQTGCDALLRNAGLAFVFQREITVKSAVFQQTETLFEINDAVAGGAGYRGIVHDHIIFHMHHGDVAGNVFHAVFRPFTAGMPVVADICRGLQLRGVDLVDVKKLFR